MANANVNVVVLTGNLTKDPEVRQLTSGITLCKLRLAYTTVRKAEGGDYVAKSNFVGVTVWAGQGETCGRLLKRGSYVAVTGRLEWWETDDEDGGRQGHEIIAENVEFLDPAPAGRRP